MRISKPEIARTMQDSYDVTYNQLYALLSEWALKNVGMVYDEEKFYQLESRITSYTEKYNITAEEFLTELKGGQIRNRQFLLDLIVNNETFFFREEKFFKDLEVKILPYLKDISEAGEINIWSMACSCGQEIYSVIFTLEKYQILNPDIKFMIKASDISSRAIDKARSGIYTVQEVNRGLDATQISRYFDELSDGNFQVKEKYRSMVDFTTFNLRDTWSRYTKYDLILCRNILYYLDLDVRKSILSKVRDVVTENGLFVVSGSESIFSLTEDLVQSPFYGSYQLKK